MPSPADLLGELASFIPFQTFTSVQERVIPHILELEDNVVVAAPTGSGKTLILEVAIVKLFRDYLLQRNKSPPFNSDDQRKAVYICPIKALANEKYEHWTAIFPGLKVVIETGDQEKVYDSSQSLESICRANIIITTPERWDSITRRWKEKSVFEVVNLVSLMLLDEIHTVHEERGAALEAVVSRMRAIKCATQRTRTRFVAISGTLPNIEDLATWLGAPPHMVFSFSPNERPVPLTIRVLPYQSDSNNPFAFDRFLSFKIFNLIRDYANSRPSIIFCSTRKQAVSSALQLVQNIKEAAEQSGLLQQLEPSLEVQRTVSKINDRQLRNCAAVGIAFHHAALGLNDRRIVEDMFRNQYIAVVCTTTTLSLGVNLPAHLVIVKGTTFYNHGHFVDIPVSEVAQMCGRAGRPGLDDHGVALILTTSSKLHFYSDLATGKAVFTTVESQLHQHIIEHVNAEIALRTIHSFQSATDWAKTTFFWLRLKCNPKHYGLEFASREDEEKFDPSEYVELLLHKVIHALNDEGCIKLNGDESSFVETTTIGRSMSRLYISFATVMRCNKLLKKKRSSISRVVSTSEAIQLLSQCEEFSDIRLRQGERGALNHFNKNTKFPLKNGFKGGREVREDWHKIFLLIQAHIIGYHFSDMSLKNDTYRLLSSLQRTSVFLRDYGGCTSSYSFMVATELLKRSIEHKLWPDGLVLQQLSEITEELAQRLSKSGIHSFADLRRTEPHKIEAICSKSPPFGSAVLRKISLLPNGLIEVKVVRKRTFYSISLDFGFPLSSSSRSVGNIFPEKGILYQLLVGDTSDAILLSRAISIDLESNGRKFMFDFSASSSSILIHLVGRNVVGVDYDNTLAVSEMDERSEVQSRKPPATMVDVPSAKLLALRTKDVSTPSKSNEHDEYQLFHPTDLPNDAASGKTACSDAAYTSVHNSRHDCVPTRLQRQEIKREKKAVPKELYPQFALTSSPPRKLHREEVSCLLEKDPERRSFGTYCSNPSSPPYVTRESQASWPHRPENWHQLLEFRDNPYSHCASNLVFQTYSYPSLDKLYPSQSWCTTAHPPCYNPNIQYDAEQQYSVLPAFSAPHSSFQPNVFSNSPFSVCGNSQRCPPSSDLTRTYEDRQRVTRKCYGDQWW